MTPRTDPTPAPDGKTLELLQGTLDMMVLKALLGAPRHGYDIMRWLRETTEDALQIEEGALYPALHRMTSRGWVEAEWGVSENNRRAKFYRATPQGRETLVQQSSRWHLYVVAVSRVLEATEAPA